MKEIKKSKAKFYLTCVLTILAIVLSLKGITFGPPSPGYGDIEINGDYVIPNVLSTDIVRAVREADGANVAWELLTNVPLPNYTLWKDVKVYNVEPGTTISAAGLGYLSASNHIELKNGALVCNNRPAKGIYAQIEQKLEYTTDDSGRNIFTEDSYIRFMDEGYYILSAFSDLNRKEITEGTFVLNVVCDGMPHVQKPLVAKVAGEEISGLDINVYIINGHLFVKVRDCAKSQAGTAYGFEITWDKSTDTINFVLDEDYTEVGSEYNASDTVDKTPIKSSSTFCINGEEVKLTAYLVDNELYLKYDELLDYGLIKRYTQKEIDDILFMNEIIETARSRKAELE